MNVRYRRREPFEKISKFDKSYHKSRPIPSDEDLDQASYSQCPGATVYINDGNYYYETLSTIPINHRLSIARRIKKRWRKK